MIIGKPATYLEASGMYENSPNRLLSRDEVEEEFGITRRWLEIAAWRGDGPPMIRLSSRCVRYRRPDIERWLSERCVASTTQELG